jgi:hypothetical protein
MKCFCQRIYINLSHFLTYQAAEVSGIKLGLRSAMRWLTTFPKAPEVIHAVVKGISFPLSLCENLLKRINRRRFFLQLF